MSKNEPDNRPAPDAVDAPAPAAKASPAIIGPATPAPVDAIGGAAPAPAIAPRCVDVRGLAAMLAVCPHTVMRMDDGGKLPPPLRLGATGRRGRKVWLIADIDYWLTHGQPSREKFMATKRL